MASIIGFGTSPSQSLAILIGVAYPISYPMPMVTPDAQFVIHWVPDMPYIEKQVQDFLATGVIPNGEDLVRIIESGKDRPVVKR